MATLYSPKAVSDLTGVSATARRNYVGKYTRYLSTEATGTPSKFTEADIKLIAYVKSCTSQLRMTHDEVLAELKAGQLDSFDWQMPEEEETEPQTDTTTALVPMAQLQAYRVVMEDAQRREEEATEKAETLQQRMEEMQHEVGEAQGKLQAIEAQQRKPPKWWVFLFGGRDTE